MAPPGLDPEEGSQRFIPFLVGLLGFGFRAVTFMSKGCVFLVQNVWMCECVCMYLQSDCYRQSVLILFLFPTLTLIPKSHVDEMKFGKVMRRYTCEDWKTQYCVI